MKIALVHMRHADSGGTERYLNQMALHLAREGHAVTIVCRTHSDAPHPDVRFVVLRNAVIGNAWRMWSFARAVERHVAAEDYDVVFGLGRTWSQDVVRLGGGSWASYLELAHDATLLPLERMIGKGWMKRRLALEIERRALRPGACRRVIANSEMVRQDVIARYALDPAKVVRIYNGVDLERFHPELKATVGAELRRALGFAPDDLVILFLGTGYGRKGLAELLDAFPALLRRRGDARLVVAGYDSSRAAFEERARRLHVDEVTRFIGGRSDPETCFAAADLYVLPTLYDPFANSTLEALASGLAVITTADNGGSEVLSAGAGERDVAGAILPRERARGENGALAAELIAWSDRERLRAAAVAARKVAEAHSQERTVRESTAVLVECAQEKSREAARGLPRTAAIP